MGGKHVLTSRQLGGAHRTIKVGIGVCLLLCLLMAGLAIATPPARAASKPAIYLPLMLAPAVPPPDDRPDYVRFAVIGDYGDASENEAAVARLVRGWRPGFIITVGDNNYGDDKIESIDARIGQFYAD